MTRGRGGRRGGGRGGGVVVGEGGRGEGFGVAGPAGAVVVREERLPHLLLTFPHRAGLSRKAGCFPRPACGERVVKSSEARLNRVRGRCHMREANEVQVPPASRAIGRRVVKSWKPRCCRGRPPTPISRSRAPPPPLPPPRGGERAKN